MSFFGKQKKTVSHYDKMTKNIICFNNSYFKMEIFTCESYMSKRREDRVPAVFSPAHSAQRIRKEPPRTLRLGSFPPC